MNDGTLGFVGLIGLLALNRLVLALAGHGTWKALFWSIQLLNLAAAIALILWGLPGLPPGFWLVNWFIALLFMWHIVENNAKRVKHIRAQLRDHSGEVDPDEEAQRQALRAKLKDRAGTAEGANVPGPTDA